MNLEERVVEEFRKSEKSPFVIVLDNVRSQSNVGSIFRTADAFLTESDIPVRNNCSTSSQGDTEDCSWGY
ncbi:MAG: hypothetical protein MZV63_51240 [Marinilabiliales bacterium]|nr:hypothetical protein [Marinilabiliales bacterium]